MAKSKSKGTGDHREIIAKMQKDQEAQIRAVSLQPTFEGTALTVPIVQIIDYVNVTESIGASQG